MLFVVASLTLVFILHGLSPTNVIRFSAESNFLEVGMNRFGAVVLSSVIFCCALLYPAKLAMACSESGTIEFSLAPADEKNLAAISNDLAKSLARSLSDIDARQEKKGVDFPIAPFQKSGTSRVNDAVKGKQGYPTKVSFATLVASKNGWECLYCVTFNEASAGRYSFYQILKHHCAK